MTKYYFWKDKTCKNGASRKIIHTWNIHIWNIVYFAICSSFETTTEAENQNLQKKVWEKSPTFIFIKNTIIQG